jgi:RNA polymerase subunit RPABC4/transcription elongation factor Spt4
MGVETFVALSVEATVARTLQVVLALGGAYLFALWFVLIVWTYRDIESRSRNVLTQVFSTSLVVLFWVPGALLYLILRPKETLDGSYQRSLEEEYLLQDLEELPHCPSCERFVEDDFVLCPHCHTRLREPCLTCARLIDLRWSICPYCGAAQGGESAEEPARVETPAARWRASARRRPAFDAAEVAAVVVTESTGEVTVVERDVTAAERSFDSIGDSVVAAAAVEQAAPESVGAPEPIPLVPTPRGRFRRLGGGQHARDGQGRAPAGDASDQVPVSGLFTSILGARGGSGGRPSPNGAHIHRVPDPVRPVVRPSDAEIGAVESHETADSSFDGANSVPAPAEVAAAEAIPGPSESELVAVRAEGKGD